MLVGCSLHDIGQETPKQRPPGRFAAWGDHQTVAVAKQPAVNKSSCFSEMAKLMEFIDHIEKNLGKTAEKVYKPKHPADALETWSDTTKLQALGYEAKTSIAEGVAKFIEWHRNYYGRNI